MAMSHRLANSMAFSHFLFGLSALGISGDLFRFAGQQIGGLQDC
jgi:hypothetical protein